MVQGRRVTGGWCAPALPQPGVRPVANHLVHVVPHNDLISHTTDHGDCLCGPTTRPEPQPDGSVSWILVHHSLDGREHHEPQREPG